MQAQLFILGCVAALSLAPLSLACGPGTPDQVSRPQFSVVTTQEHYVLQLNGPTAHTVFEHLKDPEVRRFNSEFFATKIGYGMICVAQVGLDQYSCWEQLTHDGDVQNHFPYADQLKNSAFWLRLNLKGPSMEQLYSKMDEEGDILENKDGSLSFIKQRTAITCTKRVSAQGTESFDCSQRLSAGGFPMGPGTDPMLGSGTHPVTIEVEEGVN